MSVKNALASGSMKTELVKTNVPARLVLVALPVTQKQENVQNVLLITQNRVVHQVVPVWLENVVTWMILASAMK